MSRNEWQEEQQRVNFVVEEVKKREIELKEKLGDVKADVLDIRKRFWDDVTVNFDTADDAAETHASIKQQAELMSERERSHQHDIKQLKSLHKLKESPYFGRIDFLEEGETEAESVYIGTASFVDKNGVDFYVYDWRAPISSLYYDYGPGPGSYETPTGLISGEINVKKQYIIRQGCIEHMFNTGITIGDEMLQEVLGGRSDSQMKNIVATIQKEQNQIIRNDRGKLLIVQGVAGSGKTSAALQRVAYLLYRFRNTLDADQIVLFSPNPLFNSYISTVLPELGEENMQQTTFQDYLDFRLGDEWKLEDPFNQIEYVLSARNDQEYQEKIESIKLKSSLNYMQIMDDFIVSLEKGGLVFKDVIFKGQTLISKEKINHYFYELDDTVSIPNRFQMVVEILLKEVRKVELKEREQEWVEQEIDLLDNEVLMKVHHKVEKEKKKDSDSFYEYEREQEILRALVVKRRFKKVKEDISKLRFIDVPSIYLNLLKKSLPVKQQDQSMDKIRQAIFPYEDATPYLYLKGKLEGFQVNTNIRHVFIDEAQDYSPFQFAFIKNMFPRAKLTVLGDKNQSIYAHSKISSFSALESLYDEAEIERYELTQSYRSTKQIINFAKQIIDADIEPFNREGEKPKCWKTDSYDHMNETLIDRIEELKKSYSTIAIICKTALESETLYDEIREKLDVRLMKKDSTGYESTVLIIPSYLAKGVEFDAVVVYNASQSSYNKETERKLLYTVCTRAMHSLDLLYVKEISTLLSAISNETYVQCP
ncbi:RNA polymerase recycling motor HelD [Halalkalibacter alkaliphilus]|uniref:AAA family ATPase n=1 Tax=Halalkalibacter alkaliphilus TaxID=2917993 RepID=A0A9X2CWH8_9BACI|nr:RNA polymerase recycling motor HelD [Halalkalibacter alkaliphilus]MCL7749390.1 AAA family ATPase [Halalkalibacter alkaliphilus]